ncbi:NADP-dependent oxidoreductase [Brachybacterium sp. EF45031]|uniref:NADP-dependent oxidoreductase n=1 Tax=Brachybacterium sillae TaxID=2810536 RepID=UPI00217E2AC2|nr:NADP-dependent oxidoreductase [Brachybacterium sillae]MCS6711145.1 NADP-dependent oxidoreductase [Brachybacterium sillae]
MTAVQFHLASRPHGEPTAENFRRVEVPMPQATPGAVVVRNAFVSVDPYMRSRMNDAEGYAAKYELDEPLYGGAVGEVIDSQDDALPVGTWVSHGLGWRTHALVPVERAQTIDVEAAPAPSYLGTLGMTGMTGWVGLTQVAQMREGDVVFVSGAAGAVGSLVGQLARELGASRVIGSAGSPEKVARLRELGFDAAFDYHDGPVADQLREAAPDGIDVYFDNVGGDHLEAALENMRLFGRIAMCGAISQYNRTGAPQGPANLTTAIGRCVRLEGFVVGQYSHLRDDFVAQVVPLVRQGRIHSDETIRDGIDATPQAFIDLLRGANTGKMLVRL